MTATGRTKIRVLRSRKAGMLLDRFITLAHWVRERCAGGGSTMAAAGAGSTDAGDGQTGPLSVTRECSLGASEDGRACPGDRVTVTVEELAELWGCSRRAAQQALRRLADWGLVTWRPQPGRGGRSVVRISVHPVYAYFDRAEMALRREQWAEAAFWLTEIMRECPCIPQVPFLLAEVRARLGLPPVAGGWSCCEGGR